MSDWKTDDAKFFRRLYIALALAVVFYLGFWSGHQSWTAIAAVGAGLTIIGMVLLVLRWAESPGVNRGRPLF